MPGTSETEKTAHNSSAIYFSRVSKLAPAMWSKTLEGRDWRQEQDRVPQREKIIGSIIVISSNKQSIHEGLGAYISANLSISKSCTRELLHDVVHTK